MVIKERRTKILLALFLLSGVDLPTGRQDFTPIGLDEKLQKAFDLSLNQKTRGTLSGLLKEGMIEKAAANVDANAAPTKTDEGKYSLTEKGFLSLCLEFPFFRFLRNKWDGRWRIISYEIPEAKREIRDRLRREMQGWGLGPWHRSFWLTPHPIIESLRELVAQKEEEKYIQSFESSHVYGDRNILIEKVWAKVALDKDYRELFKKWHSILSLEGGEKLEKFKKVIEYYVDMLRVDPGLPAELLGQNWIGFEAYNIFKEIKGILLA